MRILGVVIAVMLLVALFAMLRGRFRRGGSGPPINVPAFTKAGRQRTNATYEKHGWAKPYDDEGNTIPTGERTPPA